MIAVFTLLAHLIGAPPCVKATYTQWAIPEWSRNIVAVKSARGAGYGLMVGWRQGEMWVAVPAHVVFGADLVTDANGYRAGLEVRLPGDERPRDLCETVDKANPRPPQGADVDLTFICVEWFQQPLPTIALPAMSVSAGDDLRLLRADAGSAYSGRVASHPDEKGLVRTSFTGIGGMSGAPVASPAGVIGLYLGSTNTQGEGRVLAMDLIKRKAQGNASVPWELVTNEFYDCGRTRRVCVSIEGVTPPSLTLKRLFVPGNASVAPGGCVDLPEGKYGVASGGGTSCEPQALSVLSAEDPLQVTLTCTPVLGGTWNTADGDWFMCVDRGGGEATCSGLNRLGNGLLEATLSAKGVRVSVRGSFLTPNGVMRPASGSLVWTPGRLSGEIRREQRPPKSVELQQEKTP